jgi:hypothetical protein
MPALKQPTAKLAEPPRGQAERKPWKKKTPVEVFLEQEEKLRREIIATEEELKQKRLQLKKFEEARKIFEAG